MPSPSLTITSDAVLVPSVTGTPLTSDAVLVGPVTGTPLYGDARLGSPYAIAYCGQYNVRLTQGVDYLVDTDTGRIKFLSTGRLGNLDGICDVNVSVCCTEPGCYALPEHFEACDLACYVHEGYETVMQQGAEDYKTDDEKVIKMISLEAEPLPQSTPSPIRVDVGYASTPSCFTWKNAKTLDFECQTDRSAAEHAAQRTRPDGTFYFPVFRRGRYLSSRFVLSGIGGGGKFSGMWFQVKGFGQRDTP